MLFISRSGIYARQTLTNKNVGHKCPTYLGFAKVSGCLLCAQLPNPKANGIQLRFAYSSSRPFRFGNQDQHGKQK